MHTNSAHPGVANQKRLRSYEIEKQQPVLPQVEDFSTVDDHSQVTKPLDLPVEYFKQLARNAKLSNPKSLINWTDLPKT